MELAQIKVFLIVDDLVSVRKILRDHLIELGIKADLKEAKDIAEAKEVLKAQHIAGAPVEFVFSDWQMPGGSGLELLEFVRGRPEYCHLPFIMITTQNEKENVMKAIVSGATGYVIKPWNKQSLLDKITSGLKKHSS
jgi:two-component system chemotaxis response regulator CheY